MIIDSLSTIILMNLTEIYEKCRAFVANDFAPHGSWSLFEFIIRYLGGLLSAAELTGDQVMIDTAVGLGYALLPGIERCNGFFNGQFTIASHGNSTFSADISSGSYCLAEVGSFQVEFLTLARLSGDDRFVQAAMNVYHRLWRDYPTNGLISGDIGAGTDSYYEYIIKCYIQTGAVSERMLERYLMVARDVKQRLVFRTIHQNLTGIGREGERIDPIMEHLATFAGGMFAVGSVQANLNALEDLHLADELARTFWTVYKGFPAGVMPERVRYNTDREDDKRDFRMVADSYILRPESVESVYYMWKFTGLQKYRDYAWSMFQGINRSCRVQFGYAAIEGIELEKPRQQDDMESFFLAETLKYLYLTFSDSTILTPGEWVFNTEAHPVRIWDQATIDKFQTLLQFADIPHQP
jgi:mannosyl-oligosaccharide alpha-1,2-mannosidase